jgi:hypothetical protein
MTARMEAGVGFDYAETYYPLGIVATVARGECVQSLPEKPCPLPPWDLSFPGAFFLRKINA